MTPALRDEALVEEKAEGIALEPAGFWRRLGALLIDLIALAVLSSILAPFQWFGFVGFWDAGNVFNDPVWLAVPYLVFGNLLSFLLNVAYFVGFWVWRGQTPGKMALGIKVIRRDGSDVKLEAALLRYLGYLVSSVIFFIGFLWIAFDGRKQGLHDKIADTCVVKIPRAPVTVPIPKPSASV
jgi:uncharacterized RDD family membrane protein YckC